MTMTMKSRLAGMAAVLLLVGAPLDAQNAAGGMHGVSGPVTTTGDIAGGAFSPERDWDSLPPEIAAAIRQAANGITARLMAGTVTDRAGDSIPAHAQATVARALEGDEVALDALVAALDVPEGAALRRSLGGLPERPQQLGRAVRDFNLVVDALSAERLADPAPELRAVHAVLASLILAAGVQTP
jgi:non-ribosomal peptide synthetase component F